MTSPRLIAIELEGFRGFARRQRLSLDADAIVVRGDNGAGKTSLVDGFLWLFCGELAYLSARVKHLRRTETVVQNHFTQVPARAVLEIEHESGRYVFERHSISKGTRLIATQNGSELPNAEQVMAGVFGHPTSASFHAAVLTWGLLRQDAVRATLDTAGGTLHQRLAGIVGLDEVSGFALATTAAAASLLSQRTAQRKAMTDLERRYSDAVIRHRTALQDVESGPDTETSRAAFAGVSALSLPYIVMEVPEPFDLATLGEVGRALGRALIDLQALVEVQRAVATLNPTVSTSIMTAERGVLAAQDELDRVSVEGPISNRLAQAALEALQGDVCPVCEQRIDQATLRAHLQEILDRSHHLVGRAQQASDALARATTHLSAAREQQRVLTQQLEKERRASAVAHEALAAVPGLRIAEPLPTGPRLSSLVQSISQALEDLRRLYRSLSQAGSAYIDRLAGEARALQVELTSADSVLGELDGRYGRGKALERAAHAAVEHIVSDALGQLQQSFAEVFDRLNPNPAFTELRARQDILRNVNQVVPYVRDPDRGVEANPLLVFSEGQINVVALSYFLGMALNARDAILPFLILDDPLQALDTISVLGFGDLCRRIRDQKQLIITTHDRRFADILVRKLAPRESQVKTLVHDFESWTREGPSISTTEPALAEVVPLLRRAS